MGAVWCLYTRRQSGRGSGLLARAGSFGGPPADRACDEDMVDAALELGRADAGLAQRGQSVADLFLVPLVRGLAAHDAERDGLKLSQFLLHAGIHAFHCAVITVATQGSDWHSVTRRDSYGNPDFGLHCDPDCN
jgi:hypothetical protein